LKSRSKVEVGIGVEVEVEIEDLSEVAVQIKRSWFR
jgi:hypothetical protein